MAPDLDGRPPQVVEVTHNIWSGQRPSSVRGNLAQLVEDCEHIAGQKPHIVKVQEGKNYEGGIVGYERIADDTGHPEHSNCIIFVRRKGVEIHRDFEIAGDEPWIVVRYQVDHPPRIYPGVTYSIEDGPKLDSVNVHRVPARSVNDAAWADEHDEIVRFADRRAQRRPGRPLILGGDWNGRRGDTRPMSIERLARDIDAEARMRGIDGFLTRGMTGRVHQLAGRYGSDGHHPVVFIGRPVD